ncbi:MAG: N-acetylglucosamine-6-phosphate deacetylase [Arenicella sp.]|nr:N-acetylglucosamine-6-phosphate deacetylase [Arenicella sp.]
MKKAISAPQIFDGNEFFQSHAVLIEGETVVGVSSLEMVPSDFTLERLTKGVLAPGFVDWQVNGGGGVLFNNETSVEGLRRIVKGHHTGGTTSLLPTIVSDTAETRKQAVVAVGDYISSGEKGVLGLHLEGPYFASERRGTHDEAYLSAISENDILWLGSLTDFTLLVTLAPEILKAGQIKALCDHGVIVCAGHTDARSDQISQALSEGLRGFTHLYNAMRPATGREPGVVGSALVDQNSWCGIIVDGHHVDSQMVRLAHLAKPKGKLCLVTDSMATVGSQSNSFELYGNTITEQNGCLINSEGRLAGSAISMIEAVRNSHIDVGIELSECLRMASLYPATFLDIDDAFGFLKNNYRADIVHFDEHFKVLQTWVAGEAML